MSDSIFGAYLIMFLLMAAVLIRTGLKEMRSSRERYDLYMRKDRKHSPRMKFLTEHSCAETLMLLAQMDAPFDCTFEKESQNQKDQTYVFTITQAPFWCREIFWWGGVTYRVLVTPTQKGSAVWLFLYTYEKIPWTRKNLYNMIKFTDDKMLNMFAWEVEKLFEKLLDAVRVE